jgi:hypothetical protein
LLCLTQLKNNKICENSLSKREKGLEIFVIKGIIIKKINIYDEESNSNALVDSEPGVVKAWSIIVMKRTSEMQT